jgi:putative tricarboxylic transport membrane protein
MTNAEADTLVGDGQAAVDRERRRLWLSAVSAAVVTFVGAAALIGSRTYPYWTPLGPGPGFFPRWLGGLLIVCGLAWMVQLLRAARAERATWKDAGSEEGAGDTADSAAPVSDAMVVPEEDAPEYSLPTVVAIVVSLCVLAATLEVLGYQLAMFLFVLFHLLVLGRRRLLLSLVLALVSSVGVFVVFTRFLTVPLPASSIPLLRDMGF